MIAIYRLLFFPAILCALPYYGWRMWKRGGYAKTFHHRLGSLPRLGKEQKSGKVRIWIQAVSVGEVRGISPLIQQLAEDGRYEVVLTTTTSTGYRLAEQTCKQHCCAVGCFPVDFWLFNARAWKRIQPDAIVLMESELWPEHIYRAARHRVPVFLVNARLSDRSWRRYSNIPGIASWLLSKVHTICASSLQSEERWRSLSGDDNTIVHMTGNMKCDIAADEPLDELGKRRKLIELGLMREEEPLPLVLIGASTWPGEEAMLLKAFERVKQEGLNVKMLIVPRHAERRHEIRPLLETQTHAWHQRSRSASPEAGPVDILLADTTGELGELTRIADVAFIGKTLPPNSGGQSPIEAAACGAAMVYGPSMSNFREMAESLEQSGGAMRVENTNDAQDTIGELLKDHQKRKQIGQSAKHWHQQQAGATKRVFHLLEEVLKPRSSS